MNNPIIYVLVNGELNMSPSKVAAQTAHAMAILQKYNGIKEFTDETKRTVIVLEAKSKNQMDNLETYLEDLGIPAASYIDEGTNEVDAFSTTALAVGPIASDDEDKRSIFADFPLYRGTKPTGIVNFKESKKKWWRP